MDRRTGQERERARSLETGERDRRTLARMCWVGQLLRARALGRVSHAQSQNSRYGCNFASQVAL